MCLALSSIFLVSGGPNHGESVPIWMWFAKIKVADAGGQYSHGKKIF